MLVKIVLMEDMFEQLNKSLNEDPIHVSETSDSEKEDTNLLCPEEMGDNEEDDHLYNDLLDHFDNMSVPF